MNSANLRARQSVLGIVALSLFAALFTRLWYLQVLTTEEYEVAAEAVRTESVIIEAPRGRILDRQGKPLVENTRVIQVSVDYQDFTDLEDPEQSELLRNLSREVSLDEQLRFQGVRASQDPGGARLDESDLPATTTTTPGGEPGDEGTTTTTTTAPVDPDDPEAGSALDPISPGGAAQAAAGPYEQQPASYGVATGASNPNGERDPDEQPPDPITEDVLRERIEDPRFSKFKPVPVATGVSEELEAYLTEHPDDFPTVVVERTTVRKYNYGALAAHVLGYVGDITEDDLDEFQNDQKPYENDDEIGKAGIERGMERELRGTPGRRVYEVDARNRPIREIESEHREPVPGRDVYLTIDINMQYLTEVGLAAEVKRREGVVDSGCAATNDVGTAVGCQPKGAASVAIDPRDGEVLAMASFPTYDPNLFVGGISTRDYEALTDPDRQDVHNNPLLNRALSGQYAPGSTFKLFSSYAGLATGLITPETGYNDTGKYAFSPDCDLSVPPDETNCYAQNSGATPHGGVDLRRALTVSSDTFYYWMGDRSWQGEGPSEEIIQDQLKVWGLGERTGIDLPGEATGRVPTPTWLMDFSRALNEGTGMAEDDIRDAGTWKSGTSANMMVGQGDILVSPLQLAQGYATLANGGTIWKPQLVLQVTDFAAATNPTTLSPEQTGTVPFQPGWREAMIEGFDGVTKEGGGTATRGFSGMDQSQCPVAGKTGTAQVNDKNDSSLFAAFAPTPTEGRTSVIAMATVFQEAGFGASAAVPLTRRVLEPFTSPAYHCDISLFGNKDTSAFNAPLGGYFDVDEAQRNFLPPVAESSD